MQRNHVRVTLGVAIVALLSLVASCIPPDWEVEVIPQQALWGWKARFREYNPNPPTVTTYLAVDGCRLLDASGIDVETIYVYEGQLVQWSNKSQVPVWIEFRITDDSGEDESTDVTGWEDVYLLPGESRTTTIRSTMEDDQYSVGLVCKGEDGTVYGPTPPMEECPPPPSPCP